MYGGHQEAECNLVITGKATALIGNVQRVIGLSLFTDLPPRANCFLFRFAFDIRGGRVYRETIDRGMRIQKVFDWSIS
jgi:hypothetical protein